MKVKLIRFASFHDRTIGRLTVGSTTLWTLEPPWKGNQRDVSCIPCGIYTMGFYQCPNHGATWRIRDVPNRSGVEFHSGYFIRDTAGCPLPGLAVRSGLAGIRDSRKAMQKLMEVTNGYETLELVIWDGAINE